MICCASSCDPAKLKVTFTCGLALSNNAPISLKASVSDAAAETVRVSGWARPGWGVQPAAAARIRRMTRTVSFITGYQLLGKWEYSMNEYNLAVVGCKGMRVVRARGCLP